MATETIIITIPIAMAKMAIFIIGAEILLLWPLAVTSFLAMKYSKFNVSGIFFDVQKYAIRQQIQEFLNK